MRCSVCLKFEILVSAKWPKMCCQVMHSIFCFGMYVEGLRSLFPLELTFNFLHEEGGSCADVFAALRSVRYLILRRFL